MKNYVDLHPIFSLQILCVAVNTVKSIYHHEKIYYFFNNFAHDLLSCWSTCSIEIHLSTRLRLMTSPGCHSEKLSGVHVCIFQLILITRMQFYFGSLWLLHSSWFFFSCRLFLLDVNKISCIHGSFLLSPTLTEVWNFHARPEESVRYMLSFTLFYWFHKLWRVLYLHIVWRLGWKLLHLKMPSDFLAKPTSTDIKSHLITRCSWMLKIFTR